MEETFEGAMAQVCKELKENGECNQITAGGTFLEAIIDFFTNVDVLPEKADVLRIVKELYNSYIAPIDIPGIPNNIEPWIDSKLEVMLLKVVENAYDSLVTD